MPEVTTKKPASHRVWIVPLAMILLIGSGAWVFDTFKYDFWPKRFGVVVPGEIYRSGQISPRLLKKTLEEHHVKVVVDFQGEKDHDPAMENETRVCQEMGIEQHRFPLAGDGTGRIESYADAIATMVAAQRAHKPVLIHCSAGTQRTGAATAFYRLLVEKKSPEEAYGELSKYDWNARHDAVLLEYMNSHMKQLAELLVQRGVIEKIPDPIPQLPVGQ